MEYYLVISFRHFNPFKKLQTLQIWALGRDNMSDFAIFDIHQHLGSLAVGGGTGDLKEGSAWNIEEDYARRVELMNKFNIRTGGVMPASQYLRPNGIADTRAMNDLMAEYRKCYQERFPVALGTVEPLHGEEAGAQEIRRIAENLHLDGVVWHHRWQGVFINDKIMNAFVQVLAEYQLPAFIHLFSESNMEAPWRFEDLAEQHPDVTFIALDAFSSGSQSQHMMKIARRCANVLFETAALFPLARVIEQFVAQFGSERLLFGTDLYLEPLMWHTPHVLYEILHAQTLTDQDKKNIFWNNACKLFGLE
jgi:predicted TIM-barrel fold metal-dependent hydrolase